MSESIKEHIIHIDWEGPFSYEEIEKDSADVNKDFGIYQWYGTHPVYGVDTLLYIGKAGDQTFSKRISQNKGKLGKYWTPGQITIYKGRLGGSETPSDEQWNEEIKFAEGLLIYVHDPAWNRQGWNYEKLEKRVNESVTPIRIFNWGKYKKLLPEISELFYSWYHRMGEYEIYSRDNSQETSVET